MSEQLDVAGGAEPVEQPLSAAEAQVWKARLEAQLGRARYRVSTFDLSPWHHRVEVRPARPPMTPPVLLCTHAQCALWLALALAAQEREPGLPRRFPRRGV